MIVLLLDLVHYGVPILCYGSLNITKAYVHVSMQRSEIENKPYTKTFLHGYTFNRNHGNESVLRSMSENERISHQIPIVQSI